MFYSVDILTRKGRLGLIWLAATYGESKRGLTYREYRKVNISRACRDIADPVVPFALRLSSTLMVGVVRIYREQTKTVWVEVAHIWRTLKNASGLRVREIDLPNPALKEEAITDSLDFVTESFRWDLEVHPVAFLGPEGYFTVNGKRRQSPISPTAGQFSPPSLPGTPVTIEFHSPYQARPGDITLPEVSPVWTREEEPIKIPGESDINEEEISPSQPQPHPRARPRSPRALSRSPRARSRSPRALSRSPRARSRSPRARSRSPRARSRSPRARSRSPRARSRSPRARSRSPRARSRSPRARSRSPRAQSRSPRARSRSPRARSRSPRARSRSPRARSISPRARSRSPRARSRSPRARSRSPRARSISPRARSRSPRARSRSPRALSRSPRARSKSPRARSKSPRARSKSPRARSRSPRSPRARSPALQSPTRPRDQQPPAGTAAPSPVPGAEPASDDEPSEAQVLMMNEKTGELGPPEVPGPPELPTSVTKQYKLTVPTGLVTPAVAVVKATPSPPKKRRRMAIDNVIKLSNDVLQRNVDTEGLDTLREWNLDEHVLKSAKDLFMEPTTEALCIFPFLDLWKGNAVTTPEEYHSSDGGESGEGSPDLPRSPPGESVEVPRSTGTPPEKEIARAMPLEGSGVFERSAASTGFTPEHQEVGLRPRDPSLSGDRGITPEIEMEPTAPRGRSSSILRSSITGLLSPIQEPPDWEDPMDIGELATLLEQSELTLPLETEQSRETWRLVSKALGDSDGSVAFSDMWPPQKTSRKSAVKAFYHLLVLHKNGVFELKQRDPYLLTNIHIHKGVNF